MTNCCEVERCVLTIIKRIIIRNNGGGATVKGHVVAKPGIAEWGYSGD